MEYVLGVNCSGFHSSACLMDRNGNISAILEERLTRLKQDRSFPVRAISYCCKTFGIRPSDLREIFLGWNPRHYLGTSDQMLREAHQSRGKLAYLALNEMAVLLGSDVRSVSETLHLTSGDTRIRFVDHHLAHGANAFYQSGFDSADFLILDGFGEVTTGMAGSVDASGFRVSTSFNTPHSLGSFYSAFTDFLGFKPNSDEWKVMALASLGDPDVYYDRVRSLVRVTGLQLELDLSFFEHFLFFTPHYYTAKFTGMFGQPAQPGDELSQRHYDIVAAVQRVAEDVTFDLLAQLQAKTGARNLVVGGGFFMNSVCNGKLRRHTPYEQVFVGGSPDDSGVSIGSALYGAAVELGWSLRLPQAQHNYFGRGYGQDEIEAELKRRKIAYRLTDRPEEAAAALLREGKIIGWFQGGSEFGQRALGNRSILADPTRPDAKDIVNASVKYREGFRPFAPSVLAERQDDLFEGVQDDHSYFMEKVFAFRPEWRDRLPAVVHFDGSGRLQTVSAEVNPRYHALISAFEKLSGVPVVLNTSFNTNGMPLVETPGDALGCFYDSGLDALVMGNAVIEK